MDFFPDMDYWCLSISLVYFFLIEKQDNESDDLLEKRQKEARAWLKGKVFWRTVFA